MSSWDFWNEKRILRGVSRPSSVCQRHFLTSGEVSDPEEWTIKRNEQSQHRYMGILRNVLSHPRYLKSRKEELENYRIIHHIDDSHHTNAVEACGWTMEEFEQGYKKGQEILHKETEDDDDDLKRDIKWRIYGIYMRMFG
eukprot:CAMPEP_0116575292 /NCGR_PEP_ID=MMETSP0397-20121206/19875_1 /TAXON_ID=216820 /ORGANISM="Cyclophora tenuis, Strain ECT3854" /LENGTH=139 /DNA_ID=CAMNT_0004104165 /DNA_START=98 /DNA_END=517 /DNA_ORIENTATION=-